MDAYDRYMIKQAAIGEVFPGSGAVGAIDVMADFLKGLAARKPRRLPTAVQAPVTRTVAVKGRFAGKISQLPALGRPTEAPALQVPASPGRFQDLVALRRRALAREGRAAPSLVPR